MSIKTWKYIKNSKFKPLISWHFKNSIGESKSSKMPEKQILQNLNTKTSRKKYFEPNWQIVLFGGMFGLNQDIFQS